MQAFEFTVQLDTLNAAVSTGMIVLKGCIKHKALSLIQVGRKDDPHPLTLGFRLLAPEAYTILFEDRANIEGHLLVSNVEYAFTIGLPIGRLKQSTCRCVIDFLYEGKYWFHESGVTDAHVYDINLIELLKRHNTPDDACLPAQTFNFQINMDPTCIFMNGDDLILRGRVIHYNGTSLEVDPEGGNHSLALGFKLISQETRQVAFEDRARFESQIIPANAEYPFTLIVPKRRLTDKFYDCILDFLYEGDYWFSDLGFKPAQMFKIDVTSLFPTDSIGAGGTASEAALSGSRRTGERFERDLLERAFQNHSFEAYESLNFLRGEERIEYRGGATLSDDVLEVLNQPVGDDDILPITKLMFHLVTLRNMPNSKRMGKRVVRFEILRELFGTFADFCETPEFLIPGKTIEYLNDPALTDGIFDVPMSRIMLWYWLSEGRSIRPQMRLDRDDIYWWWATGAMPANRVPAVFLGIGATGYLSGPHEEFRSRPVPISRFFVRAYRESRGLQARYDIKTDEGLVAFSFDCMIHNLSMPINSKLLGSATIDFWASRIGADPRDVTAFEFALACHLEDLDRDSAKFSLYQMREVVGERVVPKVLQTRPTWAVGLNQRWHRNDPERDRGKALAIEDASRQGVTIAGLFSSQSGLGVNARMSRQTFEQLGLHVNVYDVTSRNIIGAASSTPPAFSLWHVNADAVPTAMLECRRQHVRTTARAGFFLWELDTLPDAHGLGIEMVDEIWAPTKFVADVYAQYTNKPIRWVGKHLPIPDLPPQRRRPGAPFTFLISFDFHSGVERKNPLAGVQAFKAAFPESNRDVALLLKTTEYVPNHWGDPHDQWLRIMEISRQDRRIKVITDILSDERFFALINSCDCIVTPHRAEGFGYLPAYGLFYGKAVITTNYSGTCDFCTLDNSYPTAYKLVAVAPGEFITEVPGARWADVDFDDLVANMRRVVENNEERIKKQKIARAFIRTNYALDVHAARYRDVLSRFNYFQFNESRS